MEKFCVQPQTALTHSQHLRCTHGDVKAKLNQYKLVMLAAGLCVLMQNGWYQEEKKCERHRQLDNMKVGVNICIIKNPGDSLVMPEFETYRFRQEVSGRGE
jgi:hypothetical protein